MNNPIIQGDRPAIQMERATPKAFRNNEIQIKIKRISEWKMKTSKRFALIKNVNLSEIYLMVMFIKLYFLIFQSLKKEPDILIKATDLKSI